MANIGYIQGVRHCNHFCGFCSNPTTPATDDFESMRVLVDDLVLLHRSGRTFRVEKVPLCYMTEFAWASTETRKIVEGEERLVHFLDDEQTCGSPRGTIATRPAARRAAGRGLALSGHVRRATSCPWVA